MSSYPQGKKEVCEWIRENYPEGTILDVGACDGIWRKLLPEYIMDAVEIFTPNAERLTGYRAVFNRDIIRFAYVHYDLIIFGDVIEHMTVKDAQDVLEYAKLHCDDMIIAVPWQYKQGIAYGNQWEIHIQDDLTPEIFAERYPGFDPIWQNDIYAYYHKRPE